MLDVVVVGAGLAGLVCARRLQQAGYQVTVVEKSRGVGGRVATRRLAGTFADHGVRYLEPQGQLTHQLIHLLLEQGVLQQWGNTSYQVIEAGTVQPVPQPYPRYGAADGMTAIAKAIAKGLEIWHNQRVVAIAPRSEGWQITLETASDQPRTKVIARAIVLAIPAPQALMLLEPLAERGVSAEVLTQLRAVEFDPCLSAIARYPVARQTELVDLPWQAVAFPANSNLAWVGIDSSKRANATAPLFVLQSRAAFAERYLAAAELHQAGTTLLAEAAHLLLPWLNAPEVLQVHRWRYAFVRRPCSAPFLTSASPFPLLCCGDWCGGEQIEAALRSGLSAANHLAGVDQGQPTLSL